jgi:hypothetical protein
LNIAEAFLVLQDLSGWASVSDTLGSNNFEVLWAADTDADIVLLGEVSSAVALALSILENESWLAANSDALSILKIEGGRAALTDASLLWGKLESLFALNSLAAVSLLDKSELAFNLEALLVLQSESSWAANSLAVSRLGESEVLGADLSDALSVDNLLVAGALGDTGISFESVSLSASSFEADSSLLDHTGWTLNNLAGTVNPSRSLSADNFVAFTVLEGLSISTGSSDARVSLLLEVLRTVNKDARSVLELESWRALGDTVSLGCELKSISAGCSLANTLNSGEVSWAFILDSGDNLEALIILEFKSIWASGGLAFSNLSIELLVLSTLDAGSVMEGPSRFT